MGKKLSGLEEELPSLRENFNATMPGEKAEVASLKMGVDRSKERGLLQNLPKIAESEVGSKNDCFRLESIIKSVIYTWIPCAELG